MDNYSKVLTFFMENGIQLNNEQLEALKEEFLEEFNKDVEAYYLNRELMERPLGSHDDYDRKYKKAWKSNLDIERDEGYGDPATNKEEKEERDEEASYSIDDARAYLDDRKTERSARLKHGYNGKNK